MNATYNGMTLDECIEASCDGIVGTCMDTIEEHLSFYLQRAPTEQEIALANAAMHERGIDSCDECGWWQNDNDGMYGNLCWQCAENEEED